MSVVSFDSEDRRKDTLSRKDSLTTVYSSNSRLNLLQKRKKALPSNGSVASVGMKMGDKYVTQRVLSAKTHKVKQLQNQLSDAHYHLQELSNENKMLKAMQKKQETALQRYESSNAELPQVLNSHSEEMRVQQTKFKQVKQQLKEVTQRLKERDLQYQQLKDDHQHLLDLSRDRNLQEREKLQAQVTELSAKVKQHNETISQLQRRLALEAKNFKHQLQNEINKHKDTRHDLEMAVTNADKLSTIIEMKEKLLNTGSIRNTLKSPVKSGGTTHRPTVKKYGQDRGDSRNVDESRHNINEMRQNYEGKYENGKPGMSMLERLENCTISARTSDEETIVPEPRPRFTKSRLVNSNANKAKPNQTRKSSKETEDIEELAKTVQNGMADLKVFDEAPYTRESPDETYKRMEQMKQDLMNKIKKGEDVPPRLASALRKRSTDESMEESWYESDTTERSKSRNRGQSAVSFYDEKAHDVPSNSTVAVRGETERKLSGKKVEKYCDTIISGIEKSTKLIDKHIHEFQSSKLTNDKLVEQLGVVDKINDLVNVRNELSESTLEELNNNFKMITDQVTDNLIPARKRSITSRITKPDNTNLFGDSGLTNQDLLDDLLKRK